MPSGFGLPAKSPYQSWMLLPQPTDDVSFELVGCHAEPPVDRATPQDHGTLALRHHQPILDRRVLRRYTFCASFQYAGKTWLACRKSG
jgi:hypothetical protein